MKFSIVAVTLLMAASACSQNPNANANTQNVTANADTEDASVDAMPASGNMGASNAESLPTTNAADTDTASLSAPDYPSCDLSKQHDVKGQTGGKITDPHQAHILTRADILQADLGTARKAGVLTQENADAMFKHVQNIRDETNQFVRKQGFLSGAELDDFDSQLDTIAQKMCRK